jgi:hypothetical protein
VLPSSEKCDNSERTGVSDMWKLKIMPFTVVNMGAHPKAASAAHGECHYLSTMRKRACSCFKAEHFKIYEYDLGSISKYGGKSRGQQRDVV